MALTFQEVEHIAVLARLALTDEEKERYRQQLSAILDYARRLQSVDTGDISPTAGVFSTQSPLREDIAKPALPSAAILSNAPQAEQDQFLVPPVME